MYIVAVSCGYDTCFAVRLVMDYTTSHFTRSILGLYSEIDQIHLSSEAQCVSHHLPPVDCHIYNVDLYFFKHKCKLCTFRNNWEEHHPFTNVLWIHYLADKLLRATSYPNSNSKEHKSLVREFRIFLREALSYRSAQHLICECSFFAQSLL